MNALVRQVAVLSVLWAVCEMLLPDGRQQQMVRMTASLLVMTALLSTVKGWLGQPQPAQEVMTIRIQQASEEHYQRTALAAMANQLESWCVNLAQRAGYQASVAVWMHLDGGLDRVELTLQPAEMAIIPPEELHHLLAQQLGVDQSCIRLTVEEK